MTQSTGFIYVIDDDASVRDSVSSLLRSVDLEVVTFASSDEFLISERPDSVSCIVLDIRMPGNNGLDFQEALVGQNINIPVIIMTGHGDIPMSVRAMKAGAIEFLTKPFRDQDMLDAVHLALERDREFRENDTRISLLNEDYVKLTEREKQIMLLVTSGLLNKQIAHELGISEVTVKVHRGNMMKKMGGKSLVDLVRMADILGLHQQKS
jgi:FixJ family two-component response regulator